MPTQDQDPEAKRVYDALRNISDRLAALIGSKDFTSFLERAHAAFDKAALHDEAVAKIHTLETRLEKSGEREAKTREELTRKLTEVMNENAELKRKLDAAEATISEMESHPAVKAKRAAELKARAAAITKELRSLGCEVRFIDKDPEEGKSDAADKTSNVQLEQKPHTDDEAEGKSKKKGK